jgi:hypothetical protein
MLHCDHCRYLTDRAYNLKRHMLLKHDIILVPENNTPPQNVYVEDKNVAFEPQNNSIEPQNNSIEPQNNSIEPQNNSIVSQNVYVEPQSIAFCCSKCNKQFSRQDNFRRHTTVCNGNTNFLECKYCNKFFNHPSSKYRHQKTCPSQFTMLLNTQPQTQQNQVVPTHANNVIASQTANNINNGTVNNANNTLNNNGTINNAVHIHFNNLGQEKMDHISPEFIEKCIRMNSHISICEMFDKVHKNPEIPENHNIRIVSKRQELMHVFKNDRWTLQDKNATLDEITDIYITLLRTFYLNNEDLKQEDLDKHEFALHRKLTEIQAKKPFKNHSDLRKRLFSSIMDMGILNGCRVEMKLVPLEMEMDMDMNIDKDS